MAASTSRRCCCMNNMARGAVVYMLVVVAVCAGARRPASDLLCPIADIAVFPYWSFCEKPALYSYGGEAYEVVSPRTGLLLAPEWDESNSTYYVRLAEEGATYALSHLTRELRPFVALSKSLIFTNVDTGRVLAWRNEGEDEEFLVEVESGGSSSQFQFATYDDLPLPCPLIYPPLQCKAYSILAFDSTSGLAPYVEDDVTYFKKSATDLAAFTLRRPSSSSSSSPSLKKHVIASVV